MSTILITGGAGFIGSHVVRALAAAGHTPVVFDDLSAGHRDAVPQEALVVGDLLDYAALRTVLRATKATAVIHLAAKLDIAASCAAPWETYQVNVGGSTLLLEAMIDEGVRTLVFSSTASVYGSVAGPADESTPCAPESPYAESKLAVERALPWWAAAHGLRYIALRYFNAAGADPAGDLGEDHRPEHHLIPRALAAAVTGTPLDVYGDDYPTDDGTALRDYVHVCDLAAGHLAALDWLAGGGASGVYNLGSGAAHSVLQVVRAVERVTGRQVPLTIQPRRPGDPAAVWADARRAFRDWGWTPRRSRLDTIVQDAWQWHRTHPEGYPR